MSFPDSTLHLKISTVNLIGGKNSLLVVSHFTLKCSHLCTADKWVMRSSHEVE